MGDRQDTWWKFASERMSVMTFDAARDGNEDRLRDVMNDPMPFEVHFRFRTEDNKFQFFRARGPLWGRALYFERCELSWPIHAGQNVEVTRGSDSVL